MAAFAGLTPKTETQAALFLGRFPHYDGRGVVVAILDSGVDPAAAGLQLTPDGRPKVLDLVDASGSGDIDTRAVARPAAAVAMGDAAGAIRIVGLTGRVLTLNSAWTNPSGVWRVGVKHAYSLYPGPLKARMKKERGDADKLAASAELIAAQQALAKEFPPSATAPPVGSERAELLGELIKRVAVLKELLALDDIGPVFDCVAFFDGAAWRAALDTRGTGDLSKAEALTNFRAERRYGRVDEASLLSFAINIYDDGDVVSVVTDCSPHGTHVAGIVAAYFEKSPELNGVAPGAQIVSVKIGDTRLGSMESGAGLQRGLKAVVDAGAHVINLSYGEYSSRPAYGRFMEMAAHIVLNKDVVFVSSAGNNGPGLSTVGAPGGASSHVIGVGACVSQAMMADMYQLRASYSAAAAQDVAQNQQLALFGNSQSQAQAQAAAALLHHGRPLDGNFTWSSRGPTADGALGVSICAPGGAITSVPVWGLKMSQLMNGTSMSSPNASGCIALLLSGLKARGIPYSPYSVRRALENSASAIAGSADAFTAGHGMVAVNDAFELLVVGDVVAAAKQRVGSAGVLPAYPFGEAAAGAAAPPSAAAASPPAAPAAPHARFLHPYLDVSVPNNGFANALATESSDRGIYWREAGNSDTAMDAVVKVEPVFPEGTDNAVKVSYQLRLHLESTAPSWVSAPSHILIGAGKGGHSFKVHVDPRRLPVGRVHHAEVLGYEVLPPGVEDAEQPGLGLADEARVGPASRRLGPLIRVPITVIRPERPIVSPTGCRYAFAARGGECAVMHTRKPSPPLSALPAEAPGAPFVLRPGRVHRRFLTVPEGATWLEVRVRRVDDGGTGEAAPRSRIEAATRAAALDASAAARAFAAQMLGDDGGEREGEGDEDAAEGAGAAHSSIADGTSRIVVVQATQIARQTSPRFTSNDAYLRLSPHEADAIAVAVLPGITCEVSLCTYWHELGPCSVTADVLFFGLAGPPRVDVRAVDAFARFRASALLHDCVVAPSARLKSWTTALEPQLAGATGALPPVLPLTARDTLVNGKRQYALTLTYKLSLAESAGVRFTSPRAHGVLYESHFEAALVVIQNEHGRVLGASDAFSERVSLPKGELVVTLQLRHEDAARLEALRAHGAMPLLATRAIPGGRDKEVAVSVCDSHAAAAAGEAMSPLTARARVPFELFICAPAASALPKGAKPGDLLEGVMLLEDYATPALRSSLSAQRSEGAAVGRSPQGIALRVHVGPPAPAVPAARKDAAKVTVAEALRDALIARLETLDPLAAPAAAGPDAPLMPSDGESQPQPQAQGGLEGLLSTIQRAPAPGANEFRHLSAALTAAFPTHLPLLQAVLQRLDDAIVVKANAVAAKAGAERPVPDVAQVVAAADAVVRAVDAAALAAYFGVRHDETAMPAGSAAAAEHKRCGDAKAALVDALSRKARALCSHARAAAWGGSEIVAAALAARPSAGGVAAGAASALVAASSAPSAAAASQDDFFAALAALEVWASSADYTLLALEKALRKSLWATALEVVNKGINAATPTSGVAGAMLPVRSLAAARVLLCCRLGWPSLAALAAEHSSAAYESGALCV